MDRPKHEVSLIEHLPPDIWAHVVSHLPGEQLGRLMMTGATLLWRRLKFPTVVKSIKLGGDYIVFQSWPKFLNDFPSVEELWIDSCDESWSSQLSLKIDSMRSGLRKLEFSGRWASPPFPNDDPTFILSEHLPHLEVLDFRVEGPHGYSFSWISHSPRSLTKLTIPGWDGAEIPSSLIHFQTYHADLFWSPFVANLPPSLESFAVSGSFSGLDRILPLLPASLRKLYLGGPPKKEQRFPPDVFRQLPKSLTSLQVPLDFEIWEPELLTLLPSTLTELYAPSIPESNWPLLPQQLTTLTLSSDQSWYDTHSFTDHVVRAIPFDALPRTITSLVLRGFGEDLNFCGPPSTSNDSYFPPQLTCLSISTLQLSPNTAKLLPSSLTHLEIGNFCESVCEQLPRHLRTLKASPTLMSPNLLKFLPKSLTSLELWADPVYHPWYDYITNKNIGYMHDLPDYPIHKQCMSKSFDWKDFGSLHPNLIYFEFDSANELGDSFLQHHQLPKAKEVKLGAKHFTNLCIPLLSPHLTTLDLGSSSDINSKSFQFLPRGLTDLNLDSSVEIFDSDIQHLPRTLKHAHLNHAMHLTDLCIPDLPAHLETLSMEHNSAITPLSVPRLPYPLRSSQHTCPAKFANWYIDAGVVHHRE